MRIMAIISILISLADFLAASASDQIPPVEQDTIFLRQGDRLVGKLTGIDEQSIRLRRLLPAFNATPPDAAPVYASVSILRSHVDRVEFSLDERQRLLLKNASVRNLSEIEDLWHQGRLWLPIPKSPTAEIGLAFGDLLLQSGDLANIRKALNLFTTIEKEAWSHSDAARARQGRLRATVAEGSLQEAIAEAKEIERTSKDPAILIEAKFILAQAGQKALRKLLDDNPRWEEDAAVRPQRDRLYQEALEHYFYPALFYGSEIEVASRGLWGVVEISRLAGDLRQAADAARDLIEIYPGTSYARQAQDFIDTLPQSATKQYHESETKH
jgi:hypothetical protein